MKTVIIGALLFGSGVITGVVLMLVVTFIRTPAPYLPGDRQRRDTNLAPPGKDQK
jgi:hypothetical protein